VRVNNWFTHLELDWDNPVWRHWSEALAERRMLVRYDPRGSGLSDRDVTDFALDAMVADLEAVVDALKLRRFPLLGLCQGGVIAIAYAARHPERVSRLVLYDSYPYGAFVHDAGEKLAKQARAFSQMLLWPPGKGIRCAGFHEAAIARGGPARLGRAIQSRKPRVTRRPRSVRRGSHQAQVGDKWRTDLFTRQPP
jgi:pimeloyl-ACP methyl ester carboxylesterase